MYLEADVSSRKIISKNNDRSSSISTQLLAIGAAVTCSIMPLYHRLVPPVSLKRDVWLCHRHHHLLYIASGIDFNENVLGIATRRCVDCGLDRQEVTGAASVDGDEQVTGGSNPFVVALCRVG